MKCRHWRAVAVAAALVTAAVVAGCGSSSPAAPTTPSVADPSAGVTSPASGPPSVTRSSSPPSPGSAGSGSASWPGYHVDRSRTGAVAGQPSLDRLSRAWSADLGAAVRGQPVVADGQVVAATEGNRVVALDPANGHVLWSVSIGRPLTNVSAVAGCGNIDPLGITSTPVIDPRTHTVYVVGEVSDGGGVVHHQLEGLSLATGAVRLSEGVDPPLPAGEQAVHLLQRASLALGNGRVYVSYGGNAGDCGSYHGWVVGVNESGPPDRVSFEAADDGEGGAIWQSGGAPALDAAGNLYVTTGNANPDPPQGGPDPKQYTESVVKLSPTLKPLASYKDVVAGGDEDLSTANPVLLPGGRLFAVGKTDIGFVLNQSALREVGRVNNVCGSDPDGGPAYDQATDRLFVACHDGGIQVIELGRMALGAKLSGADSAPVVVGSTVWALDHQRGVLTGYTAGTGATVQSVPVGEDVPIFTSPSVGPGLMLVATSRGVVAFR